MGSIILYLALIAIIVGWWLARQRLASKPWLEEGPIELPGTGAAQVQASTLGLGIFLAVVGTLFALVISAYAVRMTMGDWRRLPVPNMLWFNTGLLVASSVALQLAQIAGRRGRMEDLKLAVLAGAGFALLFLIGQILVSRQLSTAGYFLASNPANAFFYLLVALHGLHLSGGLVALGHTAQSIWRGEMRRDRIRHNVALCAAYWHFLLLIWLAVMALLMGWATGFIVLCGRVFNG